MKSNILYKFIVVFTIIVMLAACSPKAAPSGVPEVSDTASEVESPAEADTTGQEEAPAASTLETWGAEMKTKYDGTNITVAAASHPSIEAFKKMTPDFEALTGIKVTWDEMEEGALADKLLLDASSGSTTYDVIMNCPEFTPALVDLDMVEPLDAYLNDPAKSPEWFNYEDIMAAYRDMLAYEGVHYAIPFAGETVFLFYRKDLFEKHGLEVPKTMDELKQTAAEIQEKEAGISGISMRTRLGWEFAYMWSVFIFPFGGKMIDPATNEVMFSSQGTLDSLKYMADLIEYAPVGITSYSFPEAWDAFMQGKAAMMVEASAAAPEVENPEKSVVAGKVGYAPMPAGPAGAYSGVWGWGFSMAEKSEQKDAAWAFITYMTGEATQDAYLTHGGIISRASRLTDESQQAQFPYYQATLDTLIQAADLQAQNLGVVIMSPIWSQISEIMGTEGSRALTGDLTPEEAVESMQAQVSDLFK